MRDFSWNCVRLRCGNSGKANRIFSEVIGTAAACAVHYSARCDFSGSSPHGPGLSSTTSSNRNPPLLPSSSPHRCPGPGLPLPLHTSAAAHSTVPADPKLRSWVLREYRAGRNCSQSGKGDGYLWLTGIHLSSGDGPAYSARGRISRLFAYCSRICAVHPDIRLTAKNGVNRSIGMPLT